MTKVTQNRKLRIKRRVRAKIIGKTDRVRLTVYRSNKHIYVQVIDDKKRATIANSSDHILESKEAKMTKTDKAKKAGLILAEKLKKLEIKKAVFDRGNYKYAGRVKALCEGIREGGIEV